LKLKFWRKETAPTRTVLSVTHQTLTSSQIFYVETLSPEKAIELMKELQKEAES